MDKPIDYYADLPEAPSESGMERLKKLVAKANELEAEVLDLQVKAEEKNSELTKIKRILLPELMKEFGMSSTKMEDGSTINVKQKVTANIKPDYIGAAYAWLEKHGFDGIIKTKLGAVFNKDEVEDAKKAQKILAEAGIVVEVEKSIHTATLNSFVKERIENDAELIGEVSAQSGSLTPEQLEKRLPLDIFGVCQIEIAEIKRPKVKKPTKKGAK